MLGTYDNFPKAVHEIASFSASTSQKRLQKAIVEAFFRLNNEAIGLDEVAPPSIPNCKTIFELGVADGSDFNYVDGEERERLVKTIEKRPFSIIDFLCIIRYYRVQNETRKPLKFDYYMLRFSFDKDSTELQIFHEKGLMYVSPKDIPEFVENRINAEFSKKTVKTAKSS